MKNSAIQPTAPQPQPNLVHQQTVVAQNQQLPIETLNPQLQLEVQNQQLQVQAQNQQLPVETQNQQLTTESHSQLLSSEGQNQQLTVEVQSQQQTADHQQMVDDNGMLGTSTAQSVSDLVYNSAQVSDDTLKVRNFFLLISNSEY